MMTVLVQDKAVMIIITRITFMHKLVTMTVMTIILVIMKCTILRTKKSVTRIMW